MAITNAKENILKKIRQALTQPVPLPFPQTENAEDIFVKQTEDPAIIFGEAFTKLQGKLVYCHNNDELLRHFAALVKSREWSNIYCREEQFVPMIHWIEMQPVQDLESCDVSITGCEFLVARTGTIVMSSAQESGRTTSVYAPVHICVAFTSQLVDEVKTALDLLKTKYKQQMPSLITFATGPSRTADIEKTLVTGVHGPKEVFCFLLEDQQAD
jgi:L-lactate dehydrogenase complex protein LldG